MLDPRRTPVTVSPAQPLRPALLGLLVCVLIGGVGHADELTLDDGEAAPDRFVEQARRLVEQFDRNGDGELGANELPARYLSQLPQADRDGNGRLSVAELAEWLRRQAEREEAGRAAGEPRSDDPAPAGGEAGPETAPPAGGEGTPPTRLDPAGFRVTRDIRYHSVRGVPAGLLSLDLYAPREGSGHPVVIYIHGGAWRAGDKGNVGSKARWLTGEGFVFASVNYRLSPAVTYPIHAQDVARAVAWIHRHVEPYGGDGHKLLLMGHSAGAHLAALVAVHPRFLADAGVPAEAIRGCAPLDTAAFDFELYVEQSPERRAMVEQAFGRDAAAWRDASPTRHVVPATERRLPPMLLTYCAHRPDGRVQNQRLADALRAAGHTADVHAAPDRDHASINRRLGEPNDEPSRVMLAFFRRCLE